ncbi:Clavaminate synthase-like protein [Dichomitus squalens]|uniref:Clavaminate synthase-like protein n=1 Tax=Dichomitus squalens TaxID=114155 RepID=A0A4Q9P2V0_9APHY|nr:Clavaminate synthase-like protein [Dichomitus squalens LYAD-421 SS1]EJF65207.1 Clavaminate synthase-like protein [Dichomitus squalens LYAD-421 SS1]TBU48654.1 Clavaminate synthase-like protein [Dichomitus squalens]TBU59713.1 Clavaminate synthase-like protein [Dichomitus squalens]
MTDSSSSNFSSIPILDWSLLSTTEGHAKFVEQLRHALINVGFLYLSHPPVAREDVEALVEYTPRLFDLPHEEKERILMANSPHFFGYSRLGAELTKGKTDQREQFDFGTPYENQWKPGDPEYLKLWGPLQWPPEELLPGFKATYLRYLDQVEQLSYDFIRLIAEAFEVPEEAFAPFLGGDAKPKPGVLQHRSKIVKYPARKEGDSDQGVGPHFDGGFLTFLLQVSDHPGLQVQNLAGEWIDAPPVPGTFVINLGKALETVTQGLARATSHRVLSPPPGSTPRYSIPFFQSIAQEICIGDLVLDFKPEILKLKDSRGQTGVVDSVNYQEYGQYPSGYVNLIGRVKSHPDVAERHYPDMFKQFFPQGLPAQGSAY